MIHEPTPGLALEDTEKVQVERSAWGRYYPTAPPLTPPLRPSSEALKPRRVRDRIVTQSQLDRIERLARAFEAGQRATAEGKT